MSNIILSFFVLRSQRRRGNLSSSQLLTAQPRSQGSLLPALWRLVTCLRNSAEILEVVPCPQWTQKITEKGPEGRFEFPFILGLQNNNGFFNRPVMARTQILVHRWGPRNKDFSTGLQKDLINQSL